MALQRLVLASGIVASFGSLPFFPNVGYVGKGYDVLRGNPHTIGMVDPGFRESIFQFQYKSNKTTSDHRYIMPDGTEVDPCEACQVSWGTETVYGTSSYMESLEEDVKVEGSGWGAKFSASVDYKKVEETTKEYNTVFTKSKATCFVYCAKIATYDPPMFTKNFEQGVKYLPYDEYHEEAYMQFVETFGTHVAWSIKMGGTFGQQSRFYSSNWTKMQSTGIKVDVAAGYSAMGFSASLSSMTDAQKKQAETFQHYSTHQDIWTIGGPPPADGKVETWVQQAIKEPMPISYSVTYIDSLLTTRYFPSEHNITQKRSFLQKAVGRYCQRLYEQKLVRTCASPFPDSVEFCPPGQIVLGLKSSSSRQPVCGTPRTCRWCRNGCGNHYTVSVGKRLLVGATGVWTAYDQCFDGTEQKTNDAVDFCCTQGIVQGGVEGDYNNSTNEKIHVTLQSTNAVVGKNPLTTRAHANANGTAQYCQRGEYVVAVRDTIVCTKEPLLNPACRICSSCGSHWNLDVGIANREGRYGPWRGHGASCGGNYVDLDNAVAPHFCCSETLKTPTTTTTTTATATATAITNDILKSFNSDVESGSLAKKEDAEASILCPGFSAMVGIHANGTLECAYMTAQCRFCKSCGSFWNQEVGRQLNRNDWGSYNTYGQTCQLPLQPNDYTHGEEAVLCCH